MKLPFFLRKQNLGLTAVFVIIGLHFYFSSEVQGGWRAVIAKIQLFFNSDYNTIYSRKGDGTSFILRLDEEKLSAGIFQYNDFEQLISLFSASQLRFSTDLYQKEHNYQEHFSIHRHWFEKESVSREEILDFMEQTLSIHAFKEQDSVTIHEISSRPSKNNYIKKELLFTSAVFGHFPVMIYEPENMNDCNGKMLLVIHGHLEFLTEKFFSYLSNDFFTAGYVIAVPQMRLMEADEWEVSASKISWLQGYYLMTVRVLELLHVGEFLKKHPANQSGGYATIGHSGGSVVGAILNWYDTDISCSVHDYQSDFQDFLYTDFVGRQPFGYIHCETIPEFFYYTADVFQKSGRSQAFFDYGYDNPLAAFNIIDAHLEKMPARSRETFSPIPPNQGKDLFIDLNASIGQLTTPQQILKVLLNADFLAAITVFRAYIENLKMRTPANYLQWLQAFEDLPYQVQTVGLLAVIAESALAKKYFTQAFLDKLLHVLSADQDYYLHDLLLLRLCNFCAEQPHKELIIFKLISLMKSRLAPFYGATIMFKIIYKTNLSAAEYRFLASEINSNPNVEYGLKVVLCRLYKENQISTLEFLWQSEWTSYKEFCMP